MQVLVVDGANVVGSRPDGWWRDRAGAARRLHEQLLAAVLPYDEVVLILEGAARRGIPAGQDGRLRTVHAPGSGDDAIVQAVMAQVDIGDGRYRNRPARGLRPLAPVVDPAPGRGSRRPERQALFTS